MLLLALALAAAPTLPEASFPKLAHVPLELKEPDPARALSAAAAEKLGQQLVAFRPALSTLARELGTERDKTHAALQAPRDVEGISFTPVARTAVAGCTVWVLEWKHRYLEAVDSTWVFVTTRADRTAVDAAELFAGGGGLYIGSFAASMRIDAKGVVASQNRHSFWRADSSSEQWTEPVTDDVYRELALQPDCTLRRAPDVHQTVTGHVAEQTSHEELWIADDGKTVKAIYSAEANTWLPLTVEAVDRKAGTLSVRFGKQKPVYPLSWNADHTRLTCLNPDGGTQLFEEVR